MCVQDADAPCLYVGACARCDFSCHKEVSSSWARNPGRRANVIALFAQPQFPPVAPITAARPVLQKGRRRALWATRAGAKWFYLCQRGFFFSFFAQTSNHENRPFFWNLLFRQDTSWFDFRVVVETRSLSASLLLLLLYLFICGALKKNLLFILCFKGLSGGESTL